MRDMKTRADCECELDAPAEAVCLKPVGLPLAR